MPRTGSITLSAGSIIAEKYRLEKPLARGGMGSVWVAMHIALDEPVAIKLINRSAHQYGETDVRLRQDAEMRLQREAKSAARLRSPHIVQLLDYGVDQGVPYIVMELLEGEHLGSRLRRRGRLSLAVATAIAEQVAKALRRAHKAGIIHRDLKPDNIFLARIDDEEIVKLLDFGLVKAVRGTLSGDPTQSDMLMGSLHYMSPEQSFGIKDIDHRTDLWSLGVILFEIITGQTPFGGVSIVDVIGRIRNGPTPLATEVAPDLPPEIDAFFERALEREPGLRFASAKAMVAELETLVRELGPAARRVGERRPPDSQRITMEISSRDFLEEIGAPAAPVERQETSDSVPTERKRRSGLPHAARPRTQSASSLPLSPTSIAPRAESDPDLLSHALHVPSKPRRSSRLPPSVTSAPLATPPKGPEPISSAPPSASTKAPKPPLTMESAVPTGTLASRRGPELKAPAAAPPPINLAVLPPSVEVIQATPGSSQGSPSRPRVENLGRGPKSKPMKESLFAKIVESSAPAPSHEVPKESAFAKIVEASTTASPSEAMKASSALGRSPQSAAPAVSAKPLDDGAASGRGPGGLASRTLDPPSPSEPRHDGAASGRGPGGLASRTLDPPSPSEPRHDGAASGRGPGGLASRTLDPPSPSEPSAPLSPPKGTVAELIDQGFAALRAGDRAWARQCWEEARRGDPGNRTLELNLRKLEAKDR